MNRCEEVKKEEKDDILQELWEIKSYYSLSCNSDFEELVRKVREDIKDLTADIDIHNEALKPAISY